MAKTKNIGDVIRKWLRDDPALASRVEDEAINAHVAKQIYEHRRAAGLTQAGLAKLVGTQQSAIARLEDSNYEGHSTALLKKIADKLGCKMRIEFYKKPDYSHAETFPEVKIGGATTQINIRDVNVTVNYQSAAT